MRTIILLVVIFFSSIAAASDCIDTVIPKLNFNERNKNLSVYIELLRGTVLFGGKDIDGSYCQLKSWYEDRMFSERFGSRMLAVLLIVLGASLPLITILDKTFTNQKFWVAFVGAAIVIAQGFSQTFQYEESWRGYTVAKLELEGAHRYWQKRIIDSSIMEEGGLETAKRATEEFLDSVSKIVQKETTGFFDSASESVRNLTKK
jgi:hypothetical protein